MTTFPLTYFGYARRPTDDTVTMVRVTVDAPGAPTRQEWTTITFRSERFAHEECGRRNALLLSAP